jgi:hypothetical protein
MAIVMLMLFKYLIYVLCMREDINLMKFLSLMFCLGSKSCPYTMDNVGLRVPTRNLRDFSLVHVSLSYKNCPSARCATAANSVCNQLDVFRRQIVTLRFDIILLHYNCPN